MECKKYLDMKLPITSDLKKLVEYLMKQSDKEHLRVFYMDEKHYLLSEEVYDIFKIDQTAIYTKKLMKRALIIGASSMIVSHNYPEREAPTIGDISIVRKLAIATPSAGIDLVDYKTVTNYGCFSFNDNVLIQEGCVMFWKDEKDEIKENVEKLH